MHDLQITLWLLVFVGFIALLIAGATNRVVIYFDLKDFAISFAPWGTLLITTILIKIFKKIKDQNENQIFIIYYFIFYFV